HIVTEYLDAYANESTLRTATQWDHVRRMVEMLDYHPAPPASASTPLIVMAKPDKRGKPAKGFAVKYAPADGGKPVVFAALADLDIDSRLNALRLTGHDRSPDALGESTLLLEARVPGLKLGEPLVVENEAGPQFLARLIAGVAEQDGASLVTMNARLDAAERAPAPPVRFMLGLGSLGEVFNLAAQPGLVSLGPGERVPAPPPLPATTPFVRGASSIHLEPLQAPRKSSRPRPGAGAGVGVRMDPHPEARAARAGCRPGGVRPRQHEHVLQASHRHKRPAGDFRVGAGRQWLAARARLCLPRPHGPRRSVRGRPGRRLHRAVLEGVRRPHRDRSGVDRGGGRERPAAARSWDEYRVPPACGG